MPTAIMADVAVKLDPSGPRARPYAGSARSRHSAIDGILASCCVGASA